MALVTAISCKEAILKLLSECYILQVDQQQDDQNTEILYTEISFSLLCDNN